MSNAPSKSPYYVTTAIDYVNAAPHLGHAYEKIATDVMARFQRLMGKDVFFLTGTDEHGTKVQKSAEAQGKDPKEYTDELAQEFKKAWAYLNIEYSRFIRTTDPDHYALVEKIWRKLVAKGDIYKARYVGHYCTGCEAFLTKRDLTDDGDCAIHQRKPEEVQEENYFFRLTAYKDKIAQHIKSHKRFILPDFRANEVLGMLEELEDISVSRSKSNVSWGIPVPGDVNQVIYVWIDALSNYITGVGCWQDEALFSRYWGAADKPNAVHVIGKDILRFHAIYWPAMLMAAELPLYRTLFVHGFINLNDAKISKSLGNVISPQGLGERFDLANPDPIRYYLMTVARFGQDGNFTEDDFKSKVNADLANNLGNLLNRTLNMTIKYFDGVVPPQAIQASIDIVKSAEDVRISYNPADAAKEEIRLVREAYEAFDFQKAAELVFARVDRANRIINDAEPWNLAKAGRTEDLEKVMYTVLDTLRQTAIMLQPITPVLSQNIWSQLGYEDEVSAQSWNDVSAASLPAGQRINLQGPILPRLESEILGAAGKKK